MDLKNYSFTTPLLAFRRVEDDHDPRVPSLESRRASGSESVGLNCRAGATIGPPPDQWEIGIFPFDTFPTMGYPSLHDEKRLA